MPVHSGQRGVVAYEVRFTAETVDTEHTRTAANKGQQESGGLRLSRFMPEAPWRATMACALAADTTFTVDVDRTRGLVQADTNKSHGE